MQLDSAYPTIPESNCGNPFQLAPTAPAKLLSQTSDLANFAGEGDSFDFSNLTYYFVRIPRND